MKEPRRGEISVSGNRIHVGKMSGPDKTLIKVEGFDNHDHKYDDNIATGDFDRLVDASATKPQNGWHTRPAGILTLMIVAGLVVAGVAYVAGWG